MLDYTQEAPLGFSRVSPLLYFTALTVTICCGNALQTKKKKKEKKSNLRLFMHGVERLRSLPLLNFTLSLSGDFSLRRSAESFKFWRSRSPRSPAWSVPPGWAGPRPPLVARGTEGKKPSRRRRRRPRRGTPSPTTASRQPGPMKSASHDRRKNFLERCLQARGQF